jgi:hypothetical protein
MDQGDIGAEGDGFFGVGIAARGFGEEAFGDQGAEEAAEVVGGDLEGFGELVEVFVVVFQVVGDAYFGSAPDAAREPVIFDEVEDDGDGLFPTDLCHTIFSFKKMTRWQL